MKRFARKSSVAGPPALEALRALGRWMLALPRQVLHVYGRGLMLPLAAPVIFAIVVLPEFAQHVAEIQLGMFISRTAFVAHASDPVRLAFGAVKVAGLIVCILATARFWWSGASLRRTFSLSLSQARHIATALIVIAAVSLPAEWAGSSEVTLAVRAPIFAASWLLTFLCLDYLVGATIGDEDASLFRSIRRGWRTGPTVALLAIAAAYPAMMLHLYAHKLAIGAAMPLVWALMTADALLVGLLATFVGTALYVGYSPAAYRVAIDAPVPRPMVGEGSNRERPPKV